MLLIWALMTATSGAQVISFELVNNSGYDWTRVWLAKHGTDYWGNNLLKEPLKDGGSVHLALANKGDWHLWDVRVEFNKKGWEVFKTGCELTKIARMTIKVENEQWRAYYEFFGSP